jgi:DNA polymerase I-like protein with 3'-5' exonuclease and polymerase domains
MRRVKKDPVARLLAEASARGVRFRIVGATLQVDGAAGLHPDDRVILRRYIEDIRVRLEPPPPEVDLLEELDVQVEVIATEARAREVLAALGPGTLGFDIETALRRGNGAAERPWIRVTRTGRRAKIQDKPGDSALDPFKAEPRLAQVYDPRAETVYVFDFYRLPVEVLRALEGHRLLIHNANFEHTMLLAHGVRLRRTFCTLQMAQLALGAERGGLKLAEVAHVFLDGLDLSKAEQTSDWGAEHLSASQIGYAALDAVVAHRIARPLWAALDAGAHRAFKIANATIPAVAAMRIAGLPFDRAIHAAAIARWEASLVEARDAFVQIAGTEVPPAGPQRCAWLEARMPPELLGRWPRTDTGLLRTRTADLDRLAAIPEIRPLLEIISLDKRLRGFGHTLLTRVGPDGRLHMDLRPAATKTGRCSCSKPNLQQLPQEVRRAVVAPAGRTFVIADYSMIEFRVAAELSGDGRMREVFRSGQDIHRLNAADFTGVPPDDVSDLERNKAKRIGFGTLYGSGPSGLVASAWAMYRIEMSEAEALAYKAAFYSRYPQLRAWQSNTANIAYASGELRSVAGRPLRVAWEGGALKWTLCCNFPVQSSAAEVMSIAMARVYAALEDLDAQLLLQIHDELLVECAEPIAAGVEALLVEHMTAAWLELFPDGPTHGLVDTSARPCWAKPDS